MMRGKNIWCGHAGGAWKEGRRAPRSSESMPSGGASSLGRGTSDSHPATRLGCASPRRREQVMRGSQSGSPWRRAPAQRTGHTLTSRVIGNNTLGN
jgi:hypothetical protein